MNSVKDEISMKYTTVLPHKGVKADTAGKQGDHKIVL
jgi:hypothetical protein